MQSLHVMHPCPQLTSTLSFQLPSTLDNTIVLSANLINPRHFSSTAANSLQLSSISSALLILPQFYTTAFIVDVGRK